MKTRLKRGPLLHSLALKIGSIIIVIEIGVLSLIGGFYIKRFSREVDRRVETSVQIPGMLMAEGALTYAVVANRQRMERLVGQELVDAMVLSIAQRVFYSLNPDNMGKQIAEIADLNPAWFTKEVTVPFVKHITEKQGTSLISVTPIFAMNGRAPFLFVYLKINTTLAEAEKAKIARLFWVGSVIAILVTSIAIFLIFELSIFTRIQSLLHLVQQVEKGDFTVRTPGRIIPDEIGRLQNRVNSMVARLQGMMTALQKSQKRYRAVVEDSPAMICRFLPDGTLTFVNSEYCRSFHQSDEQLLGQNFFQLMTGEKREAIHQHFQVLTQNDPITNYRQEVPGPAQRPRWQQWTGRALFNQQGDVTEYQALGHDITEEMRAQEERDELEKQLQHAQKMEAIGTLAGGIAHDFNNILGGIIGYTELVQDTIDPGTQTQHYLTQILKACHRAKDLVLQILTFSRQGPAERQPLHLHSMVKEALKLLQATLPANIALHYNAGDSSYLILADPTQIHQILMNLCTNAAHAMRATGGILTVTLDAVHVTADNQADYPELDSRPYVRLEVSDTGHGIDPGMLQRIFDPYFTTKALEEGTGLGLAVTHGIVKHHGGVITVRSAPGQGTTFTVFLPQVEPTVTPGEETVTPTLHGHERILFVEDETFLVETGQKMLEHLGYQVVTATNGQDALQTFHAAQAPFDLVITDQTMPHMTGVELAKHLLELKPDLPIILCTGFSEVISEDQAKALGIRDFVLKPLSRQELAHRIRTVLDDARHPVEREQENPV